MEPLTHAAAHNRPPALPALVQRLRDAGHHDRPYGANLARFHRDPGEVWLVTRGAVDLFAVTVSGGHPNGRRHHLTRLTAGTILPGIAPIRLADDAELGLLAVGVDDARVAAAPWPRLWSDASSVLLPEGAYQLVERWCEHLVSMLDVAPPEREMCLLASGGSSLAGGECGTVRGHSPLWVTVVSGRVRWLGVVEVTPGSPPWPLPAGAWLEAEAASPGDATDLRLQTTAEIFGESPSAVERLAAVHTRVLQAYARSLSAATDARDAQLARRIASQSRRLHHALSSLARTSADTTDDADWRPDDGRSLLERAFRRLAQHQGFAVRIPPGAVSELTLPQLARASQAPVREVMLAEGWWRDAAEPMIAHRSEDGAPVALLPRPRGGLWLWDPATGKQHRVTRKDALRFDPQAFAVYAPLPATPPRARDLVRFALHGTRGDLAHLVVTTAALSALGIVTPVVFANFVDDVLPTARWSGLVQVGVVVSCVALASSLVQLSHALVTMRLQTRLGARVQAATWSRLLALPAPFFRRFTSGDLAQRANSIEAMRELLSQGLLAGIFHGLAALGYLALMFAYDLRLALIGLAAALANGLVVGLFTARALRLRRALVGLSGEVVGMLSQYINSVAHLRVAGAEVFAYERWAYRFAAKRDADAAVFDNQSAFALVGGIFPVIATAALFAAAGSSPRGTLATGAFVGLLTAFNAFNAGVADLVRLAASFFDLVPLMERAAPIFEALPEHDPSRQFVESLRGRIELSRVTFRYNPDTAPILHEIDLVVEPGEFVAVVGPSGSGKSTLLRLLLGFERPDTGGVFYDGQDLATLDIGGVRRQIGVVLQNGELEPTDIFRNIVGTRNLTLDDAWAAARVAGLEADIRAMPMGMHTLVGHSTTLSGGQRQRIFIARAVASQPRILLLDEATSALDASTQGAVMSALDAFKATRIVIAHRLSTVRNAHRILVLEAGRIVQTGTFEQLLAVPGPFRTLAARQVA